jgi:putative ABC transport system ATP-binding protein
MPESIIAVERVTKQVADATGTLTILHEVDFQLVARESVAIVGASGSGKSTLLSILAGLDVPSSGTVRLAGVDLFSLDEDARAQATDMLRRVGLGERLSHYPRVMSGGEQQRVALARAFVTRPALLLADEPTGSLDFATGAKVMDLMFEMNREAGTTLVLVTHDRQIAARCDRQLRMEAGRLTEATGAADAKAPVQAA